MQIEYVHVGTMRLLEALQPKDGVNDIQSIELGMSESLAHGLVSRLTAVSRERSELQWCKAQPRLSGKRAAAYRHAVRYLRELVPPGLGVCEVTEGDISGKSKDGLFTLFHFAPEAAEDQLVLLFHQVDSRHVECSLHQLARLTRHSLMRLFYRLKVTQELPVLQELRDMALRMYKAIHLLRSLGPGAKVFVPSPHGAFVVANDREGLAWLVVKTWISDARLIESPALLRAIFRARTELGIVFAHPSVYPVLSDKSIREHSGLCMGSADPEALNDVLRRLIPDGSLPEGWWFCL